MISGSHCDPLNCSPHPTTADVHDSRVYVVLKGPYSISESATATVDKQSIGLIKSGESQYIRVDSGNHDVVATTINLPTTFKSTVTVGNNQYYYFEVACDPGKVTFKADGLYALDGTSLHAYVNGVSQGIILPGQTLSIENVPPGLDIPFTFLDDSKKLRYSTTMTIQYESTNFIEIPYR
ncbi:MAG: hypothetical protein IPM69_10125 [Ignavibacteria bacterium]|nr:hypothetical protein [Ignavibacteria bacterium]